MTRGTRVLTTGIIPALLVACEIGPFGLEGWDSRTLTVLLSGTVRATQDGAPVAGATVQDAWGGSGIGFLEFGLWAESAVTDSSGHYTLRAGCSVASCPDLDLVAHLDRFEGDLEPQVRGLRFIQSSDSVVTATLDFSLRPIRPITVSIYGRVTSAPSALPVPNATVTVMERFWPFQMDSTTTDSLGMYRIVAPEHCGIGDGSCIFGSVRVLARQGSRLQVRDFFAVDVPGDSLDLAVSFDNLQ